MPATLVQSAVGSLATSIIGGDFGPGTRAALVVSVTLTGVTAGNTIILAVAGRVISPGQNIWLGPPCAFIGYTGGSGPPSETHQVQYSFNSLAGETMAGPVASITIPPGASITASRPNPNLSVIPNAVVWTVYVDGAAQATLAPDVDWFGVPSGGRPPPVTPIVDPSGDVYAQALWVDGGAGGTAQGAEAMGVFFAENVKAGTHDISFLCGALNGNPFFDSAADLNIVAMEFSGFPGPFPADARFVQQQNGSGFISIFVSGGIGVTTDFGSQSSCAAAVVDLIGSGGELIVALETGDFLGNPPVPDPPLSLGYTYLSAGHVIGSGGFPLWVWTIGAPTPPIPPPVSNPDWLVIREPSIGLTKQTFRMDGASGQQGSFRSMIRQRGTADIPLRVKAGDAYKPTMGTEFFLFDQTVSGFIAVFAGTFDRIEETWDGVNGDRLYHVTGVSLEQALDVIVVPPQRLQGFAGDIVTLLFNQLMGGSPIVLGTIHPGKWIVSLVIGIDTSPFPSLAEVLKQLAIQSLYIWYIDPALTALNFTEPDLTAAPFDLTTAQVQYDTFKWDQNRADYRNRQILQIAPQAFAHSSEQFNNPPSWQKNFLLRELPSQITDAWTTFNTQNTAVGTFSGIPADGDTITITYPNADSIYNWAASAPYTVGQTIIDPAGHLQQVTIQGTSGNAPPTWNDSGSTTSDGPGTHVQPGFSGGVIWQDLGLPGGFVYTFRTVVDNTEWGDVLIGASAQATALNLVAAINALEAQRGATYSLPTWEHALINADAPTAGVFTIRDKSAGAGYKAALTKSCPNFSWSAAITSGGATRFNTVRLNVGQANTTNTADIYWQPGNLNVACVNAPGLTNASLAIEYTRLGGDCIQVEDSAEVAVRAAIEGGTGKYQRVESDTSQTSNLMGLLEVQQDLAAFKTIPVSFSFDTLVAGLLPGQLLTFTVSDLPIGILALVTGPTWVIQEVQATLIPKWPYMDPHGTPAGAGHYRYTVTVINAAVIGSYLDFWQGLSSGGGSAGNGANGGGGNTQSVPGTGSSAGNGSGAGQLYEQQPRGVRDGNNVNFLLDFIPTDPVTFEIVSNTRRLSPEIPNYILAAGSNHLIMIVAPLDYDDLWCRYVTGSLVPGAPVPTPIVPPVPTPPPPPTGPAYYVSPLGNDTWSGLLPDPNVGGTDGPFLTLGTAQSSMSGGAIKTTFLRAGTYSVSGSMNFTSSDNGESWFGYPGETAVIDGGGSGTITMTAANNVTWSGLTFQNFAANGIFINFGDGLTFQFNTFIGLSHNGINGNFVTNSLFTRNRILGQSPGNPSGPGSFNAAFNFFGTSSGNTVNHNYFANCEGGCIAFSNGPTQAGCSNNLIDRNLCQNVCTNVFDAGPLYIYGPDHGGSGNQITNNVATGVGGTNGIANQVKGLYLDDETSHVLVSGNIVSGTFAWAMMCHGGDHNTYQNNILDLSGGGKMSFYQQSPLFDYGMAGNVYTKNLVYSAGGFPGTLHDVDISGGDALPADSDNLYFSATGAGIPNNNIVDTSPVYANPQFTSPATADYSMPPTSAAFVTVGFVPLPTDQGP